MNPESGISSRFCFTTLLRFLSFYRFKSLSGAEIRKQKSIEKAQKYGLLPLRKPYARFGRFYTVNVRVSEKSVYNRQCGRRLDPFSLQYRSDARCYTRSVIAFGNEGLY